MKKFTTILALLFAMVATAFAEHVETSDARRAAETFLQSKMNAPTGIRLLDYADRADFPNFYVFGNDHSFVIIAADNAAHPVLGYSTENAFGMEDAPENVRFWLKGYNDEIGFLMESRIEASPEIRSEWDNLLNGNGLEPKTRTSVSPLIRTIWNQTEPFNNLCPSNSGGTAVTGCVATAMAQVMNYWEHPVRGTGSHSYTHSTFGQLSANFGNTVYDWDHMKNSYLGDYTNTEATAVATLMYHCGVAVEMNYGTGSSGAFSEDVPVALKTYFGYSSSTNLLYKSSYSDSQWISMLKTELDGARPLYYSGSGAGGHAFVCDGYDEGNYFHFNWGWGGSRDGYFAIGALNPGGGGTGSGSGTYNNNNAAIFNCQPNTPSINPPTISATVNGRNVSLTWNSVSNAVSYKLYRDDNLIASSLTSTSYADNNVTYGNHAYYVKSVKSDGTMSLKSNTAVADVHFEGPVATNLQYSQTGGNIHLSWTAPASESAILQYGTGSSGGGVGYNNGSTPFYWAQRYPVTTLTSYAGMAINKVSVYFQYTGTYTLYIYTGNETGTSDLLYQTSYSASSTGWKDINIPSPVALDYTKDLWVVMYAPASISYPACFCSYSGSGVEDAAYYSSSGSGWYNYGNNTKSWLMKTYITDGTYTYNIYRNGSSIASNVSNTYYNDNGLANGSYTYYVKTNYYGGESDASNSVTVNIGSTTNYTISASANPSSAGTITGAGTYAGGSTCTLTASANTGYTFFNWTKNGTEVSTNSTYSFTVTGNATYVANFSYEQYMISVSASPAAGGTVSGGGAYTYGQSCTLTATPNSGYTFVNWTRNGSSVSTSPTYNFTVTQSDEYIAHFEGAGCDVVFDLEDSYGDGWNGNKLVVSYGSTSEQLTFTTGYSASYTLNIPDGSHVTLGWIAGSYTSECSFTVSYGNGDVIYEGNNLSSSFSYEFDVACPVTGITQTTHFVNGWTWWSTYIEEDGGSCLTQLENGLGTSGQVIKNQSASLTHIGSSWYGGFTSLDNAQTYRVKTNAAVDVDITGPAVATASHPVTLKPNWTWIGYPCTSSMSVATALAGITPTAGDVLKSQTSSTVYIGTTWAGSLNTITPGMGLMYYSKKTSNMTLVYPTAKGEETKPNLTPENNHWQPDMAAYPDNMTVLAVVEMNDMELQGENYELAAFANGECRGSVQLLYIEPLNRYMAILTVAGDAETELRFGLYDVTTGEEYLNANETLTYQSNAIVGDLDAPLTIRFRSNTGLDELSSMVKVYPNPVDRGTQFSVDLPTKQTETVRVEVLNMMGSILSTETATGQPAVFKAPDTPGVYTLRIISDSKETCCRKLVVK